MTPIQTNKPVFFNSEGEPLNGTIYIGQPDSDPRTNPKTVTFRDAGGVEFTASQPLRTNSGRIVYNGKPIVALVDGEYSMLVFDNTGVQVDYSRSINPEGGTGGGIADFSEVTRVGLTLSEIKAFDVSVGETVKNIGKATATDFIGGDWLAVSATGSPANDDTIIDFDNGLQGRRVIRPTGLTIYDEPLSVVSGTLGTGGILRSQWNVFDLSSAVPNGAYAAILKVGMLGRYPSSTTANTLSVFAYYRKSGSSSAIGNARQIGSSYNSHSTASGAILYASFDNEITVPIDETGTPEIEIYFTVNDPFSSSGDGIIDYDIGVRGYYTR